MKLSKLASVLLLLVLLLTALPAQSVYAAGIIVNSDEDTTVPNDGNCTLREAINNANADSDTTGGDCTAGSGADTITFSISGTITLGSTLPNISSEISIDGNGQDIHIDGNNSVRIFEVASDGILSLNHLIIQNGNSSSNGGGIYNNGGIITTISNSTFSSNFAYDGGGIYNDAGTMIEISSSTFSDNHADDDGGGIFSDGTIGTISNSVFSDNYAEYYGSGIRNNNTITTISNSTFSNNYAYVRGGGIYNDGTITTISDSTFSDNYVDDDGGGGIYNAGTITIITDGTFSDNYAYYYGGGIYNYGDLIIKNSTFSNNVADYDGGAIENDNATLEITNSTFTNNFADDEGGAIDNLSAQLEITNATFSGNEANHGGAIYTSLGTTTLYNTIISASPTGGDCSTSASGTLTADTYNLDTDDSCGNATQSTEAQIGLGILQNNGGATQTMAITNTSAAYDAGDNTTCENQDQRGVIRPLGAGCDIGAYEAGTSILIVTDTNPSSGATATSSSTIDVVFSEAPVIGSTNPKAADFTANYLLVERGDNAIFDTQSCSAGIQPDDVQEIISSVSYNPASITATLHLASPLADGNYRLFICGTTSIWSAAGLELNNGQNDTTVDFTVQADATPAPATLPQTGFPHGRVSALPEQPTAKAYTETAMMLEIPKLGVSIPIVGVPQTDSGWDVTWLNNSAGYLAGSAFPTWAGNTVITGHVWDSYNNPGVFSDLKTLKYGDQVQIHAWGLTYTYEVRESNLVTKKNVSAVLQSEEYDWVTLVTCEFYNPFTGDYLFRRAVRAVLVSVK